MPSHLKQCLLQPFCLFQYHSDVFSHLGVGIHGPGQSFRKSSHRHEWIPDFVDHRLEGMSNNSISFILLVKVLK